MPWNKVEPMVQRKELLEELLLPGANISASCKAHNISRKTAYKWLNRYKDGALSTLSDHSKARHSQPMKTAERIEKIIVNTHEQYPYWGARKLRNFLINETVETVLPSVATITRILSRYNCKVIRNNKSKPATIRFEKLAPNDLWQMDFKGSFMLHTHRCYPLTILDDHSRYSIGLKACENEKGEAVKAYLIGCFKRFGIPKQINVDNGNPWGKSDLESYTKLAMWLVKQGVRISHSSPYHPQTNGKLERFHRTLKLEVLHDKMYKDNADIQKTFFQWQHTYNYLRPHDALGGQPPCSRYQMSPREYSDIPRQYEYDPESIVRKVLSPNGIIKFKGNAYRVGKALCGEHVAIKETAENNVFSIFFMDLFIKKLELSKEL